MPDASPAATKVHGEFAASLQRHQACPRQRVAPGSLRDVLEAALAGAPALAGYVFDDQRQVRKHVAVFVNGQMVHDRQRLDLALAGGDRVVVLQALTGG